MFARLVEMTAQPGKRQELVATVWNELHPAVIKQPGFIDSVGLTSDTNSDGGAIVTFWASKADADRYWNSPEFQGKLSKLKPLLQGITTRTFNVEASTCHKIASGEVA